MAALELETPIWPAKVRAKLPNKLIERLLLVRTKEGCCDESLLALQRVKSLFEFSLLGQTNVGVVNIEEDEEDDDDDREEVLEGVKVIAVERKAVAISKLFYFFFFLGTFNFVLLLYLVGKKEG